MEPIKRGKVRDTYQIKCKRDKKNDDAQSYGDYVLAIVASDRVSAFDSVIPNLEIEGKGVVLTSISRQWAELIDYSTPTKNPWCELFAEENKHDDLDDSLYAVSTAYIDEDFIHYQVEDQRVLGELLGNPEFAGRIQFQMDLWMIPFECIVRGYITGSLWKAYHEDGLREFCGVELLEGLQESDKLPEPIFTPTTKAPVGEHDENVTIEDMIMTLSREEDVWWSKYEDVEDLVNLIRDVSIFYYKKACEYAEQRGVIIADTKFEFGIADDGYLYLADEILTPDSSRFWPADNYKPGRPQKSLDKQIIRDCIKQQKQDGMKDIVLPPEVIWQTQEAYQKVCDMLFPED